MFTILSNAGYEIKKTIKNTKEEIKEQQNRKKEKKKVNVEIEEILKISINIQKTLMGILERLLVGKEEEQRHLQCEEKGVIIRYEIEIDKKANIVIKELVKVDEGEYDVELQQGGRYRWEVYLIVTYKEETKCIDRCFEFTGLDEEGLEVLTERKVTESKEKYWWILDRLESNIQ